MDVGYLSTQLYHAEMISLLTAVTSLHWMENFQEWRKRHSSSKCSFRKKK